MFSIAVMVALSATASPNAKPPSAQQMVKQTADQVLKKLQQERPELKAHPAKIYALIKDNILPHFDIKRMGQWALGINWRRATPAQRERFLSEFRDLLVSTYGYALLRYDHEQIQYLPTRSDPAKDRAMVRTQIQQADGKPIPVNYRLYRKQGEWKVYDLSIDGVSLVSNYRDSFTEQIRQYGMDGLIQHLAHHRKQTG